VEDLAVSKIDKDRYFLCISIIPEPDDVNNKKLAYYIAKKKKIVCQCWDISRNGEVPYTRKSYLFTKETNKSGLEQAKKDMLLVAKEYKKKSHPPTKSNIPEWWF